MFLFVVGDCRVEVEVPAGKALCVGDAEFFVLLLALFTRHRRVVTLEPFVGARRARRRCGSFRARGSPTSRHHRFLGEWASPQVNAEVGHQVGFVFAGAGDRETKSRGLCRVRRWRGESQEQNRSLNTRRGTFPPIADPVLSFPAPHRMNAELAFVKFQLLELCPLQYALFWLPLRALLVIGHVVDALSNPSLIDECSSLASTAPNLSVRPHGYRMLNHIILHLDVRSPA